MKKKFLLALSLLGQKNGLDVGQNSALSDGHTREKFVQLLVVANGELEVPGDDPGLLVVAGGVAGQLQKFGSQVLHDCSQIDRGAGPNPLSVVALAKETVDATHWELETGPA